MKTITKTAVGLILTVFYACNNTTSHSKQAIENNSITSIRYIEGQIKIDTSIILANQNLSNLLSNLENGNLREKTAVSEIPEFIKAFLDSLTGGFSIANPGEDWQVGCTPVMEFDNSNQKKNIDPKTGDTLIEVSIKAKNAPKRKLIYLGLGNNIALMTYYTGGIGVSEHILIFKFDNTKITDFWCGNTLTDLKNKSEILNYMKANRKKNWGLNTNIIYI